ncbi:MAG TPA: DUF6794 domain-containing protein [Gemmatimonadaceae bacterium]
MRLTIAILSTVLGCSSSKVARPTLPPAGLARVVALGGPEELAPVFGRLDSSLSAARRDTLRRTLPDSSGLYHMSIGLWLRNEVIRDDTTLSRFMNRYRIRQRDDMSDLLLQAYGAYLRGTPIDVPAIIARIPPPPTGFRRLPAPTP